MSNSVEGYATQVGDRITGHRTVIMAGTVEGVAIGYRKFTGASDFDPRKCWRVVMVGVSQHEKPKDHAIHR